MSLSISQIDRLTQVLNSPDQSIAEQAAADLDALIHPPRPTRAIRGDEIGPMHEAHYGPMRGSDALLPLLDALEHGTQFARAYAASALGVIKDPRAIPLLAKALSDPATDIRLAALKGLWFFADPAAVFHVIPLLKDAQPQVARAAVETLGFMGAQDAVPALLEFYERGDLGSKTSVIYALGNIRDPRALPLLKAASQSDDRKIRSAARSALARNEHLRRRDQRPDPGPPPGPSR